MKCSKCGENEKRETHAWCNECVNAYNRMWKQGHRKIKDAWEQRPCTRCGVNKRRANYSWCRSCWNEYTRLNRAKYKDLADEAKKRQRARALANWYRRRGVIVLGPCEKCGAAEVQMHHDDYAKPLAVRFLCVAHHLEEHGR